MFIVDVLPLLLFFSYVFLLFFFLLGLAAAGCGPSTLVHKQREE